MLVIAYEEVSRPPCAPHRRSYACRVLLGSGRSWVQNLTMLQAPGCYVWGLACMHRQVLALPPGESRVSCSCSLLFKQQPNHTDVSELQD